MKLHFRPLSDAIGAEIMGVDLSRPIELEVFAEIRRVWLDHNIVLFRGQDMSPEEQIRFSRYWGEIELHTASDYHMLGHPEVFINSNIVKDGKPIGAQKSGRVWHSDSQFLAVPSSATILHAREVPPDEGDTQYANMYRAYEALPTATKQRIVGLHGTYSRVKSWAINYPHRKPLTEEQKAALPDVTHPIVRTHPETGRKALYIGSLDELVEIVGVPIDEGKALARELFEFSIRDRFVHTHRWRVGDVIVWDNRCSLHRALPFDEDKHRRLMHRTTIKGDKPFYREDAPSERAAGVAAQ